MFSAEVLGLYIAPAWGFKKKKKEGNIEKRTL